MPETELGSLSRVVPGVQAARTIIAVRGTVGEKIIKQIASENSDRYPRQFAEPFVSTGGAMVYKGVVTVPGGTRFVDLEILPELTGHEVRRVGCLVLEEQPNLGNKFVLNSKAQFGPKIEGSQIRSAAHQVISDWVVHGKGWLDRSGNTHELPHVEPEPPEPLTPRECALRKEARLQESRARRRSHGGHFGNGGGWKDSPTT